MIVISKKSIEAKVRHEAEGRAITRRQVDILEGRTKSTGPQRGDYKICREGDKILREYKKYRDPRARREIENNYYLMQREYRLDNG
jgi:hypothetical protein